MQLVTGCQTQVERRLDVEHAVSANCPNSEDLDLLDVRVPHLRRNVLFFFMEIASHEKIPFKRACAAIPIQLLSMAILILVID